MLRAILDQLVLGRMVLIAPVDHMADLVSIQLQDVATSHVVEETSCAADEHTIRHVIRRLEERLDQTMTEG